MNKKVSKMQFVIVIIIFIGLIAALFFINQNKRIGNRAIVSMSNGESSIINLSENKIYTFTSNDIPVTLQVEDEHIAFIHSACHDHICEKTGELKFAGDMALCAPAGVTVLVE